VDRAEAAIDEIVSLRNDRLRPAIALPWLAAAAMIWRGRSRLSHGQKLCLWWLWQRAHATMRSRRHYGRTEIRRLREAGLLRASTVIGHAGWTSPDDLVAIKVGGASVACCPSSSQRLGTGALELGRYPELLSFGVNVTLGSGSSDGE
jgi:hypothetical protein